MIITFDREMVLTFHNFGAL